MAKVAHKTAAEKLQEIVRRPAPIDQVGTGFGQLHHQTIRIDSAGHKHRIPVAHLLENGRKHLLAVLDLDTFQVQVNISTSINLIIYWQPLFMGSDLINALFLLLLSIGKASIDRAWSTGFFNTRLAGLE